MDVAGWLWGLAAAVSVGLLLAGVGAVSRWRVRDRLRGPAEVPDDRLARLLTRLAITAGLVLLALVVASTYYGARTPGASVMGVPSNPATWALTAALWAVVLWQLLRGRLAPYPGGWSGVMPLAILWIFPAGPVALAFLATSLGRVVDWDHAPGKGLLAYVLLGLLYVAVPVTAFHLQNRRRRERSMPSARLEAAATG